MINKDLLETELNIPLKDFKVTTKEFITNWLNKLESQKELTKITYHFNNSFTTFKKDFIKNENIKNNETESLKTIVSNDLLKYNLAKFYYDSERNSYIFIPLLVQNQNKEFIYLEFIFN